MDDLNNWALAHKKAFYYFAFSMAIPSTVLCVLQMVTIVRHKQFAQSSFYKLFCIRGIADVLMFVSSSYGNRLPALFGQQLLPIYRLLPNWALVLFYYTTTFTYQATNIATLLMLMNRFSAIAFPFQHKRIWKKAFVPSMLLLMGIPFLTCLPLLIGMDMELTEIGDGFFAIAETDPAMPNLVYANQVKAITSFVFLLLSLVVNVLTLIAYKKSRKLGQQKKQKQQQNDSAVERKLLLYALFTFAGHALVAIFLIIMGSGVLFNYAVIIYSQYPWVSDLGTLVLSSWLLLGTSATFRHQFLDDIRPKWVKRAVIAMQNNIYTTPVSDLSTASNHHKQTPSVGWAAKSMRKN